MASFSVEEMDMYGDDDDFALPSKTPGHVTRWWQRWARMLLRSGTQPQPLLPLYHTRPSFDQEKLNLLGYDGAQDEKPREDLVGTVHPPGLVGAMRSLTCCCSKS